MIQNNLIRKGIIAGMLFIMFCQVSGCGYILHPERRHQSVKGGRIDAGIAVLDGLLLFFGILPGVVAFAVDFTTNTIYLPPDQSFLESEGEQEVVVVKIATEKLELQEIERIVNQYYGTSVRLGADNFVIKVAENLDEVRKILLSKSVS